MRPPSLTTAQLQPLLERILRAAEGETPIMLVRADPDHAPDAVTVAGRTVEILASSSPLEIRSRVSKPRSEPLAVITGCDNAALGDDLVARAVRRKVYTVDRWQTVSQLFGVDHVTRALSAHNEVADALIEARPSDGYRPAITKVLDLDTALDALTQSLLGLRAESLADVLDWAETHDAPRAVRNTNESVLGLLESRLVSRFGAGVAFVFAAIGAGVSHHMTAYALAADVIYHRDGLVADAAIRLEVKLEGCKLAEDAYRHLAAEVVERVRRTRQARAPVRQWLATADDLLDDLGARPDAWRSDVLPSGFSQRLARAVEAIEAWRVAPDDDGLVETAEARLAHAEDHLGAEQAPHRAQRLEMAARIVRRMAGATAEPGTLAEAVRGYVSDGAWFDRARMLVSQGDTEPAVRALCEALTVEADRAVNERGEKTARLLALSAHHLDGDEIGVEHLLDQVVAPVATAAPTLVLVLDGMGWPSFLDVLEQMEGHGWQAQRPSDMTQAVAAMAVLPTVTELSRTSLLCGMLRSGDKDSERRAFSVHASLVAASKKSRPPQLFHKTDLRAGGLDTLASGILDTIGDDSNRIVGLVINGIDEHLKDVAPPTGGWRLDDLAPLNEVLDAARRSGREIVLTADHGHVLERNSIHRTGEGGERWRQTDTGPPGEGEIEVRGPRVLTDDGAAILPWAEKLRYGPLRNGYHGGITAAEAIVPVVVLSTDDRPDDWVPTLIKPPAWWYPPLIWAESPPSAPIATSRVPQTSKPVLDNLTLFDADSVSAHPAMAGVDPIRRIMTGDYVAGRLSALRLDADRVADVLRLLDAAGTAMGEGRIADHVGMPRMRIGRLIIQMQRLLNIDGYAAIESANGEVRFNRALLETQLGLE